MKFPVIYCLSFFFPDYFKDSIFNFFRFSQWVFIYKNAFSYIFSYFKTKNVPWHILAPAVVACDIFSIRRSAHPAGGFLYNRKCNFLLYKKDPSLLQWIWNLSFGGGMWESNPPGTLLTPHTGFEDQEAHQSPNYPHITFRCSLTLSQFSAVFNTF